MTIQPDKLAHAAVSVALMFGAGLLALAAGVPLWWAAAFVLALGALRELAQLITSRWPAARAWADRWTLTRWAMIGNAEWGDMAANAVGVACGRALLEALRWLS